MVFITFYLMSHHNASSKWSRSLQATGPIWSAKLKWREFRMNFASYFTGVAFSDLLRTVFFPTRTQNSLPTYFKLSGSWWIAMVKSKLLGGKTICTLQRYILASKTDEILLFFPCERVPQALESYVQWFWPSPLVFASRLLLYILPPRIRSVLSLSACPWAAIVYLSSETIN